MKLKTLLLVGMTIALPSYSFAQAGSFLSIPLDSKSISLGSTYAASANNNAIFTNFAANSLDSSKLNISLSYRPWLSSSSDSYDLGSFSAAYAINSKHHISIGARKYSYPSYLVTDDNGNSSGEYSPEESSIGLGYAYRLSDKTAISATINYISSDLADAYDANTFSIDLGFKSSYKNISYGLMVRNLGPELDFGDYSVELPTSLTAGISYSKLLAMNHKFTASSDASYISTADDESGFANGLGLEYQYKERLALRTGYYHVDDAIGLDYFSLGCGTKLGGFSFDFAWLLSNNDLKNDYSLSCSWNLFQRKKSKDIEE
jgi:opacity protein-like surface antigen